MLRCNGCGRELDRDEPVIEVERTYIYCPTLCAIATTAEALAVVEA